MHAHYLVMILLRKYGGSEAIFSRVAAATSQKNEGYDWVSKVKLVVFQICYIPIYLFPDNFIILLFSSA